jgi:hypothetical protein
MPSLTDLFNPTFLMFLGILVLVVALLVVYFETKFREQNHKISSMLSLVSSLAEELNGTKMVVQHLSMRTLPNPQNFQQQPILEEKFVSNNKLIPVSDDEDSDSESCSDSDSDSDSESDSESDSTEILDEDNNSVNSENSVIEIGNNDIKVLKLNINKNNDDESSSSSDENNLDFDDLDNLDELDELDNLDKLDKENSTDIQIIETKEDYVQPSDNKTMDLKSININLEETKNESMDYKKMSLPKLRSIVTEKGLTPDATKLKKNELFKLLGIE